MCMSCEVSWLEVSVGLIYVLANLLLHFSPNGWLSLLFL